MLCKLSTTAFVAARTDITDAPRLNGLPPPNHQPPPFIQLRPFHEDKESSATLCQVFGKFIETPEPRRAALPVGASRGRHVAILAPEQIQAPGTRGQLSTLLRESSPRNELQHDRCSLASTSDLFCPSCTHTIEHSVGVPRGCAGASAGLRDTVRYIAPLLHAYDGHVKLDPAGLPTEGISEVAL